MASEFLQQTLKLNDEEYQKYLHFVSRFWTVTVSTWLVLNGLFGLVYRFDLFSKYKIQEAKWPDRKLFMECLRNTFLEVIIFPLVIGYFLFPRFQIYEPSPSLNTILWQLLFCWFISDVYFYWSHRLLHHRWFYKHIHKKHHEFKVSVSIAASYCHPIEALTSNFGTMFAGPFLLTFLCPVHSNTFLIFMITRYWESIEAHSGYYVPFSPWSLEGASDRHDYHHSHNVGNFGVFPFWDWLCGTDVSYKKWRQEKKHN